MILSKSSSLLLLAIGLALPLTTQAETACSAPTALCLLAEADEAGAAMRRAADRDEILFAIISAELQLGEFDLAFARTAQVSGLKTRSEALGEVSRRLAQSGAFERAIEVALSIPDERQDSVRVKTLEAVAAMLAASGDVDAAFEAVIAIDNPFRRSEAQAVIAAAVAGAGDQGRAIRVASKIATDYWFSPDQNQRKVASGVVSRAGEFDQTWFYHAMAEIARVQAVGGDAKAGVQTALAIPDAEFRSRALSHVGVLQAADGDIDGAYQTARRIEAAYGDGEVLLAITDAMAAAGDFDGAKALGRRIAEFYGDYGGLRSVALRLAAAGEFDQALAIAGETGNPERRTEALTGIAVAMTGAGALERAIKVSKSLGGPGDEARALVAIATELARLGQIEAALAVAADHASYADQGDIEVAVALAQARAGDIDGAAATARSIEDEFFRALALAGIAPLLG